jgi:hypothetical protein
MNNNKNINYLKNALIFLFFLLVILVPYQSSVANKAAYAQVNTQACIDSGGTISYAGGSQPTCVCPAAGFQLEGDRCTSTNQVCADSGGSVQYDGSQLRCICPANLRQSVTGNSCVAQDSTTGAGTDQSFNEESSVIGSDRDDNCEPPAGTSLNRDNCGIINLVVVGTNFLSAIAGIVIVASFMIAGFQYMTAQDNAGQIQKAKSRIITTLLALTVFIFMYALLNFLVPGGLGL